MWAGWGERAEPGLLRSQSWQGLLGAGLGKMVTLLPGWQGPHPAFHFHDDCQAQLGDRQAAGARAQELGRGLWGSQKWWQRVLELSQAEQAPGAFSGTE